MAARLSYYLSPHLFQVKLRELTGPLFYSKSSVNGKNANYISEDDFEFPKLIPIRAQTAPPRPLTEIEEFRRSPDFLLLENTVMMSDHLKQRADEKYDLDSEDGQRACKRFLN